MVIFVFLLKTTVVFVTLFSLYQIFLKNTTFLRLRRWFLISTLFLSFLIPWASVLMFPKFCNPEHGTVLAWIDGILHRFAVSNLLEHDLLNVFMITVLGVGFAFVTVKYTFSLVAICRFMKGSHLVSKNNQFTLRTGNKGAGSFCFLKTIYLCGPSLNEQNMNIILEHEKAHIRQKHYLDIWLSAICDFFFWFCPFTKQFQRAWEETLECLADREAIRVLQIEPIVYQSILYANVEYPSVLTTFNHAFGRSMIAKRLLFISKEPTKKRRIIPPLFFSFVVTGIITAVFASLDIQIFQLRRINEIRNAGYSFSEVTTGYVLDCDTEEPVSNAIVKANDAVAVTDKDGFFFIKKKSSTLTVQHVAYNKKEVSVADSSMIRMEQF